MKNIMTKNQLDLLKLDAKRYRHLREKSLDTIDKGGVFAGITPDNFVLNGFDLDEAIDKEMQHNAEHNPRSVAKSG